MLGAVSGLTLMYDHFLLTVLVQKFISEEGRGKREDGRGKKEEGRGKMEEGRGKRE